MIYTCTLNPAIDLFIDTQEMLSDQVNRTDNYTILANGKGVNVSFILQMLSVPNTALGVGGGFTNQYIEDTLTEKGIPNNFVHIDGTTRINVFTRVKKTKEEFKLVNKGPFVPEEQLEQLFKQMKTFSEEDTLVISGSFARGISPTILTKIGELSNTKHFKLIIDTSYSVVLDCLKFHPYLIKPNTEEIMHWFQLEQEPSNSELIEYTHKLIELGAQNVLLSLGGDGAVFTNGNVTLIGNAPVGEVVNTACSGDTMLGTFLAGVTLQKPLSETLAYSIAAGSSTAFTAGLTDFKDVPQLLSQITVKSLV